MAQAPAGPQTCNADISHLYRRINRLIYEMQHAQSAGVTFTIAADHARITKALADLKVHIDTVRDMGIPDQPETQPEAIQLDGGPDEVNLENDDFKAVVDQLYITRDELVGSQSSRLGGGFIPPDHVRADAQLTRINTLFAKFIPATDPKDNPESTPSVAQVGSGRTGI